MEYVKISFLVVLPLFLKLFLGFLIRQSRILSDRSFKEMNNVVFKVFLPLLMFINIYQADFSESFSIPLILFALLSLSVLFIVSMIIVPKFEPLNPRRGVLVQVICRSNFILFGIPMALSLYGDASIGKASVLVGFVIPYINTLSIVTFEFFRGSKPSFRKISKGIITNPIIIAAFCASFLVMTSIRIPPVVESFIREMGNIATPLALVILGGSVTFSNTKNHTSQLIIGNILRLIIVPAIGLSCAILIGFRSIELVLLLSLFSSPAAVSSYTVSLQMDGDGELAGQLVVSTTVFSIITIFFWVFLLTSLQLI